MTEPSTSDVTTISASELGEGIEVRKVRGSEIDVAYYDLSHPEFPYALRILQETERAAIEHPNSGAANG